MPKGYPKKSKSKRAKTVKVAPIPEIAPLYSLRLEIAGQTFNTSADTLEAAIFALKQENPKGKGIFTLTTGERTTGERTSRPIIMPLQKMRRLFSDGMTGQILRAVLIKRLTL